MTRLIFTALAAILSIAISGSPTPTTMPAADDVLQLLREGNERFASGHAAHPHADERRRMQTSREGQHPVAAIVSCSDSRVPVELIFDEGIGDLFVIRVAGNICADDETGSLEYAIEHLQIPVLIVVGHSDCGAVTAVARGDHEHARVLRIVEHIRPAVEKARLAHRELSGSALVAAAVRENVWHSIEDFLSTSEMARQSIQTGRLRVVGAVYDLATGRIEWLGAHPEQAGLLSKPQPADPQSIQTAAPTTQQAEP